MLLYRPHSYLDHVEQDHSLSLADGEELPDPGKSRRLLGRLLYLTITRPELSYYLHCLTQFMQSTKSDHWDAAVRVVPYIKGSPGQGIDLPMIVTSIFMV